MTISKSNAEAIAKKLTESKKTAHEKLYKEFTEAVKNEYEKQLPKDIVELANELKEYFAFTRYIFLNGHGFNFDSVAIEGSVISNNGYNNRGSLKLTSAIADKLKKMENKWATARDKYDALLIEVTQTLLAARTYKNIAENLPEAKPYLPTSNTSAIIVNFTDVRKKINAKP